MQNRLWCLLFISTVACWNLFGSINNSNKVFVQNDVLSFESNCEQDHLNSEIWPLPRDLTTGEDSIDVAFDFKFKLNLKSKTLDKAFGRYRKLLFPHAVNANGKLNALEVQVENGSELAMKLNTDESYSLTIDGSNATLKSKTIYGALRGLETFSQLIVFDFTTKTYTIKGLPMVIHDAPRFPHRGLMIDTSRHFLPLYHIRKVIDAMTYSKLNVLHWHMVDEETFPLEIRSVPQLWNSAYRPQDKYLQSEVATMVEYARERAIRVIIEIDVPGHASRWCVGLPDLCPSEECNEPLDVSKQHTFDVVQHILHEMTGTQHQDGLFPDNFIHLGGDEVNVSCWDNVPHVKAWLHDKNMTSHDALFYFYDKVVNMAFDQGKIPIQWVDAFEQFPTKLDKRTVIHIWKDKATLRSVVAAGFQAILSNCNSAYLDWLQITWDVLYMNEPHEGITDPAQQSLVLGGQAEMWGETVDPSDLQSTIWPRAAAYAERLWSPKTVSSVDCALPRLKWFRCLLLSRGVQASPVTNKRAREAPPKPGSCFI